MYYIGIDIASGKPCDLIVIDEGIRFVEALRSAQPAETAQCLWRTYPQAIIAVDAPRRLNHGLMADKDFRDALDVPPNPDRHLNCRVCEYELSRRNVALYFTPHQDPPPWMQVGFSWYEALLDAGYGDHPLGKTDEAPCILEYFPYASFVALLRGIPPKKETYEGRKARVELLRRLDPGCDFGLFTADMIDALVGAVTAARFHHGLAQDYGEQTEGFLTVAAKLPDRARPLKEKDPGERAPGG